MATVHLESHSTQLIRKLKKMSRINDPNFTKLWNN